MDQRTDFHTDYLSFPSSSPHIHVSQENMTDSDK